MTMFRLFVSAALIGLSGIGLTLWPAAPAPGPETVQVPAGAYSYRPAGEFRQQRRVVDAPTLQRTGPAINIMKYQVSEADYAACVADAACPAVPGAARADMPQTGVNHGDATAYALWLSERTDETWRLPTDEEWLRAAADRAFDVRLGEEGADPSKRWIASYRREVERRGAADLDQHPLGSFGENSLGVADIAGNVWEWTDTCFASGTLTADGAAIATAGAFCGVRAAQGKHRAYIIDFVRDARSGGCAAGVPPDFLGFRLVRDPA